MGADFDGHVLPTTVLHGVVDQVGQQLPGPHGTHGHERKETDTDTGGWATRAQLVGDVPDK